MQKCKITSIKSLGKQKTYNMTMKGDHHNYAVYSPQVDDKFVISKNSCCYAYLSYQTAYLKANYPDEFACAFMNTFARRAVKKSANDWKHVAMMEKDCTRTLGIKILPRTLNDCGVEYKIARKKDTNRGISNTEIRPSICCKGLGLAPAMHLVENQPYVDLEELAKKTDSSLITSEVILALIEGGYFKGNDGMKQKDAILDKFAKFRKGLKAAKDRGVKSHNIFAKKK